MGAQILVIDDDPILGQFTAETLSEHDVVVATTGEDGLEQYAHGHFDLVLCDLVLPGIQGLEVIGKIRAINPEARVMVVSAHGTADHLMATLRQSVVDFLVKPFTPDEMRCTVSNLLADEGSIEVVSATAKWVELLVPASFQIAASLEGFFNNLHTGLHEDTARSLAIAFRELLNNAIEHGCKGDRGRRINVSYVHFERAIMYRIQDPGSGFDFSALPHAAVSYPDEPTKHLEIRAQQGLRAGGYGLLWIQNLADEVVFNERRNQVIFIKYLDPEPKPG